MSTTEEKIAVMQAYVEGKTIQFRELDRWNDLDEPAWQWNAIEYRVKPSMFCDGLVGTTPCLHFHDKEGQEGIIQQNYSNDKLYLGRINYCVLLNKDGVAELVGVLNKWVDTGELE